jgi:hypothetical protein
MENLWPGGKKKYTSKQKRKAHHIKKGYTSRGISSKEAERRAWATVNKQDKGGKRRVAEDAKKSGDKLISPKLEETGIKRYRKVYSRGTTSRQQR